MSQQKKAESFCDTIELVIGQDRIDEFCEKWLGWREGVREAKTLDYYVSGLRQYFPHVECVGVPVGSKNPVYYLIYTTRKKTGRTIMQQIIMTARRKGSESIEKWLH